jgi:hypothetical protein
MIYDLIRVTREIRGFDSVPPFDYAQGMLCGET